MLIECETALETPRAWMVTYTLAIGWGLEVAIARPTVGYHLGHLRILLFLVYGSIYVTPGKIASVSCWQHPPPFKMYGEGGGREFFLWNGHYCINFFGKIKRLPKEVGRGFHILILQGHGSLMLIEFSWGILRNSMTLLRPFPLISKFAKLWEATYPHGLIH